MSPGLTRNVIYCNDANALAEIATLPYTDVLLNFLAPDGNGNLTGPMPDPGEVKALQNAGTGVLISLGGSEDVFPSEAWQQYAQDPNSFNDLVDQVAAWVNTYGLSGVDIDYEDDNGFGGPAGGGVYDGVQFLINLTNALARATGGRTITHAPQPPYFDPNGGYNDPGAPAPYIQVADGTSADFFNNIAWFNVQFYNNSSYDEPASTKLLWYQNIAAAVGDSAQVVIGAPVSADAAGTGYLPVDEFVSQVVVPLHNQFQFHFGGVMGWNFADDPDHSWAMGIGQALGISVPTPPPGVSA
jgi:chitinase